MFMDCGEDRSLQTLDARGVLSNNGREKTMARIAALQIDDAPEASKPVLKKIESAFGRVPNIFATLAHSPTALKALMGLFSSLEEGDLAGKAHEAIALRVGQKHGCRYCTAAHTAKAISVGAEAEEAIGFRKGQSNESKIQAVLTLAEAMVDNRGQLSDVHIQAAKDAGISEAELLETVAIVACNTFTNYVNTLAQTEVDFPAVPEVK